MSKWTITALHAGDSAADKSACTYLVDIGRALKVPNIVYVIEGKEKIIVDTTFESVARTKQVSGETVWQSNEQKPEILFRKINLDPAEVKTGVNTHLHYDHCGNNNLFPNAKFYVQRDELRYAFVPNPGEEPLYFSPLMGEKPSFWGTHFEIIDGDMTIAEGISLIKVPGHTPGSQAVLVDTDKGVYCISGDAVFLYENLEKWVAVGVHENVTDCFKSMEKMKRLADYIIPSHEPEIFRKESIVKFPEEATGFATRRVSVRHK